MRLSKRNRTILSVVFALIAVASYVQKQRRATPHSAVSRVSVPVVSVPVVSFRSSPLPADADAPPPSVTVRAGASPAKVAPSDGATVHRDIGFRTRKKFDDHFIKHGKEFGNVTQDEYLLMAQTLRDEPLTNDILEEQEKRGGTARFDKRSGAFMVFQKDLTILTFFHPNDGEAYFHRAVKA
jgi:hypothetical protein